MTTPFCKLCGRKDGQLDWCQDCQSWFCPVCKKKYPARIKAIILEAATDPRKFAQKVGKVLNIG